MSLNNKVHFKEIPVAQPLPPCSSKLGGVPDVPDDFQWPQLPDKDCEIYGLTFVCQINCADFAPHDIDKLLPQAGMLYFFFDDIKYSGYVYYYDGDISLLKPFQKSEEAPFPVPYSENAIEFGGGGRKLDFFLDEPECANDPQRYNVRNDQLLLQLSYGRFGTGDILFYIDVGSLAARDFSTAQVEVVYD